MNTPSLNLTSLLVGNKFSLNPSSWYDYYYSNPPISGEHVISTTEGHGKPGPG